MKKTVRINSDSFMSRLNKTVLCLLATLLVFAMVSCTDEEEEYQKEWPGGTLPGRFSVSASQQVCFSQGNLQVKLRTQTAEYNPTWRFATHQYDFVGNPDYKVHLQINFGSKLPFGPPNSPRYMATGRMQSYQRVDLGFSKSLKNSSKTYTKSSLFYYVKEAWICAEILNVIDRQNVASYEWVTDFNNRQYAVENSLTGRRFNVKLSINF